MAEGRCPGEGVKTAEARCPGEGVKTAEGRCLAEAAKRAGVQNPEHQGRHAGQVVEVKTAEAQIRGSSARALGLAPRAVKTVVAPSPEASHQAHQVAVRQAHRVAAHRARTTARALQVREMAHWAPRQQASCRAVRLRRMPDLRTIQPRAGPAAQAPAGQGSVDQVGRRAPELGRLGQAPVAPNQQA
jgi:hypothetical protein